MSQACDAGMRVIVEVPASTANLGPGFDALGVALAIRNRYAFTFNNNPGVRINILGEGAASLPTDTQHLAYQSYLRVLEKLGKVAPSGFELDQLNRIPFAGGLGNSATAIVAGVLAANAVAGNPLSPAELLAEATAIEGHPDNVAPALVGGLLVCAAETAGVKYVQLPVPGNCRIVLAVPNFALNTALARQALPSHVPLCDASFNVNRVSLLVAALCTGQTEMLALAMQDKLHQPYRAHLVPGLEKVCNAALQAGAAGAALSGAGPTVMALTFVPDQVDQVGKAMVTAFASANVTARYLVTEPCFTGATTSCEMKQYMNP